MKVAPDALRELAAGRQIAIVSGTNGKTTTTTMLRAALETAGPVASNAAGSNMPAGLLAALMAPPTTGAAVLEVDEAYLRGLLPVLAPTVVALLNLSRDQLDRHHEVSRLASRWRQGLADHPPHVIVANADDPLVMWAASGSAAPVVWVAGGMPWSQDAALCPRCAQALRFGDGDGWACSACDLHRPDCAWTFDGVAATAADGRRVPLALALPGRANRCNATMALAAADALDRDVVAAGAALSRVGEVQGRYARHRIGSTDVRLLLAKNPAGWVEALEVLGTDGPPVVLEVNDGSADGRDPSWLWDVPFEQLSGRPVVVTGSRGLDLSVRLLYAGVEHRVAASAFAAVSATGSDQAEYVGNYTAFQSLRAELARGA